MLHKADFWYRVAGHSAALKPPSSTLQQRDDVRRWILHVDAEAALEMFMQMQPPIEPALVMPILSAQVWLTDQMAFSRHAVIMVQLLCSCLYPA